MLHIGAVLGERVGRLSGLETGRPLFGFFSWGDVNKCLFTPAPVTDLRYHSTQFQLGEALNLFW